MNLMLYTVQSKTLEYNLYGMVDILKFYSHAKYSGIASGTYFTKDMLLIPYG